jgi:TolA-binding protein
MYYFRRGGYDSGIIYFKDVLNRYPNAPTARLAQLRLVDSYKAIRYKEDAADACATLRKSYPNDADVTLACTGVSAPISPVASTPTNVPPSSTGPPPATRPAPVTPPTP